MSELDTFNIETAEEYPAEEDPAEEDPVEEDPAEEAAAEEDPAEEHPAEEDPDVEDPAAEFLAREQDELASLEDDGFTVELHAPAEGNVVEVPSENDLTLSNSEIKEPGNETILSTTGEDKIDEDIDLTNDSVIDSVPIIENELCIEHIPSAEIESKDDIIDYDILHTRYTMPSNVAPITTDVYSAISQADKVNQEPERVTKWREEQIKLLEEKDRAAEVKRAEWIKAAKHEMEEWYKHSASLFEKSKVSNRESEASFIEKQDKHIPGHEWERICRLCEFDSKHSGNKKDVSRMRSIILQLQHQPSKG